MTDSLSAVELSVGAPVPPTPPEPGAADGEGPRGPTPRDGRTVVEGIGTSPMGGRLGVSVGSGSEMVGVGRTTAAPATAGIPNSKAAASKTNPTTRADATVQRYTTLI